MKVFLPFNHSNFDGGCRRYYFTLIKVALEDGNTS